MMIRTSNMTVVFAHAFVLQGLNEPQPAGAYVVETDEELIEGLSAPAYRRVATWIRLRSPLGRPNIVSQTSQVDPKELSAALTKDAAA